jgi:insertion element IS1 protein InsB
MLPLTHNNTPGMGGQQQTMVVRDACPECGSTRYKKNGHIHNGKQNYQCKACGRQCVQCSTQYLIGAEQRALIERLLLERISLRGMCRAVGVGLTWVLGFLVECFQALPAHVHIPPIADTQDVTIHRLEAEADEMGSFVGKKANKPWIWIAMDAQTRQVIAFHIGDRSRKSAKQLWANIPAIDQHHATFYTDVYEVYKGVIPSAQHTAITKQARKTNHVERFNNTLRQRVSRLVRETLSFSKKLANHIGAIKYFICHYNLTRAAALHG